jgi:hypothetical protein
MAMVQCGQRIAVMLSGGECRSVVPAARLSSALHLSGSNSLFFEIREGRFEFVTDEPEWVVPMARQQ